MSESPTTPAADAPQHTDSRELDTNPGDTPQAGAAEDGGSGGRARRGRVSKWVARFGVAGLIFFTVKGLLWLLIPAAIAAGILKF